MKFHPVYYMISGWPSVEKTMEMVDRYMERGVTALQFDMPARNPDRESDFIKERMLHARRLYDGCDVYMDMMRSIRARHPDLEMHLVVYAEIVYEIGLDRFTQFCKDVGFCSVLAGGAEMEHFVANGIPVATIIGYGTTDEQIEAARRYDNMVVNLLNKNPHQQPRAGYETWDARIKLIRERGVKAPVFCNGFIKTKEALEEAKAAGADGAYIGSILMQQWGDEEKLWDLLSQFQSVAE